MIHSLTTVWTGKDGPLLDAMIDLYTPDAHQIIDVCCNARRIWKGSTKQVYGYDIDPTVMPDKVCSWDALPDADNTIDALIFDPPHLPRGTTTAPGYEQKFGIKKGELPSWRPPLVEAFRVLKPQRCAFVKVQDFINARRLVRRSHYTCRVAERIGFRVEDIIIKVRRPSIASSTWKKAMHARTTHCYWIVLRKPGKRIVAEIDWINS